MTKRSTPFSPEVRERAARMVFDHQREHGSQYAAIRSIAAKIGCSGETLRNWVRQAERDQGQRPGPTTDERERIKALERENRELRQANEILRKASVYFAMAELDRWSRTGSPSSTITGRPTGSSRFRVLPIAPSTYHAHAARRADPSMLPARARSDAALLVEIRHVFERTSTSTGRGRSGGNSVEKGSRLPAVRSPG